jgi:hypothetical protein
VPFLAPLGLLGLLFIPLIVALYILRLRRDERTVSSTYLWQQLVRDVEANAPWQRLRRSLLLLLQLLLVIALAVIVARPFGERPAGLARDLVLVIDASASMRATDVFPDRLAAAKRAAIDALADLPSDGRVSVVVSAEAARQVANEVTDKGRATRAIEAIEHSNAATDLTDALKLAGSLAARARGAEVLVVTDDAFAAPPDVSLPVPVRVLPIGRDRHNQAIAALAVRADATGVKRSAFVSVANLDSARVTRRLEIFADGVPVTARDILLDALRRTEVVIDEVPGNATVVEARLVRSTAGQADPVDQLAVDDAAWAIVPPTEVQQILLVGPGNVYLQKALALLPNVELYGVTADEYAGTTGKDEFELIVFDGVLPPELPKKPILAIAPPRSSDLGAVSGKLTSVAVGEAPAGEALLRNVDLTRLHVAESVKLDLPSWARAVIPGPGDAPLLYAGIRGGLPTAVLAFDLRQSDLPLQIAWPILVANLTGELLGRDPTVTDPIGPGSPLDLRLPPDATALRVTRPDGRVVELAPGATGASTVTFVATDALGVYVVEAVMPRPSASPSPSVSPTRSPSPTASASSSASPGSSPATSEPPGGSVAEGPFRFAVDLFDLEESNIAPGDGARIAAVGSAAAAPAATGTARDEWWLPLALLALALLLLEWLVYERDGARRIWQRVRRGVSTPRLRRRGA